MAKKTKADRELQKAQGIRNPPAKRLYTLKEGAEYLGRTEWGMRDLIWKREIPVVKSKSGRKIYIDVNDLDQYVDRNKAVYS